MKSKIKMHNPNKKRKYVFLALFCGLLSFILIGAVVESVYLYRWRHTAWVDIFTQYDERLGWTNIPNGKGANEWGEITHNELGDRSKKFDAEKNQIVLLGDSVAWGYGVGDKDTIASQLEGKVSERGYQVTNLGVTGYGLGQTYLHFKDNLERFKKLKYVVLVLNAENDLLDVRSNSRYGKSKPLFVLENGNLKVKHQTLGEYSLRNIYTKSIILRKITELHPLFKTLFNKIAGDIEINEAEGRMLAARILLAIERTAETAGAKFVVVNSPSLLDYKEGPIQFLWAVEMLKENKIKSIETFYRAQRKFKEELPTLYFDDEHYSAKGSAFIADQIYSELFS